MFYGLSDVKNSLFRLKCDLSSLFTVDDAPWEYTEEPHTSRRKEILKKHPEIKQLMGYDPSITYIVLAEVFIQFFLLWVVRDMAWGPLFILSYVVSGTLNHSLVAGIHEIGHNLAFGFKHHLWNRVLGIICDLPLGVPLSVTFRKSHTDHHRCLCDPELDVGVPARIEGFLFQHPITRILWLILLPLILAIRPLTRPSIPLLKLEVFNIIFQIAFDVMVLYYLGPKSLFYCIGGTLLGLGLHPLTGHFLSEHYMFTDGLATSSYYGPLNPILFNTGMHVEHHDFPYLPWRRLPEVRRIAPEFYDDLPQHTSWCMLIWRFIVTGPQTKVNSITDMITMNKKSQ